MMLVAVKTCKFEFDQTYFRVDFLGIIITVDLHYRISDSRNSRHFHHAGQIFFRTNLEHLLFRRICGEQGWVGMVDEVCSLE